MVVIVFTAFMLIADTVTLVHQHHEGQKEHTLQQKEQDGGPGLLGEDVVTELTVNPPTAAARERL